MELTEQELIKKNIRMNRFKIIMDIILIVILILIAYYIFLEIESFKIVGKDVCKMCMDKTGAICFIGTYIPPIEFNNPLPLNITG